MRLAGLLAALAALPGCTRDGRLQPVDMWNGTRLKPYEESPMARGVSSSRVPPPGAVARGERPPDDPVRTGRVAGKPATTSPLAVTPAFIERGQERFNIYCSPCHGRLGDGQGMAVKRGFPHPPDYAIRRLRDAPIGHFYDVMTNGYGVMYSQAQSVPAEDRWAIASYIRVLQATRTEVPEDTYLEERRRAREQAIPDPNRPMRVEPGH